MRHEYIVLKFIKILQVRIVGITYPWNNRDKISPPFDGESFHWNQ